MQEKVCPYSESLGVFPRGGGKILHKFDEASQRYFPPRLFRRTDTCTNVPVSHATARTRNYVILQFMYAIYDVRTYLFRDTIFIHVRVPNHC